MRSALDIAIVGGGIGGLFAANALLAHGLRVGVYEQAPALGEVRSGGKLRARFGTSCVELDGDRAREFLERLGQRRIPEHVALAEDAPVRRIHRRRVGAEGQHLPQDPIQERRAGPDHDPRTRQLDGGRGEFPQAHPPEALPGGEQALQHPGHGDRGRPNVEDLLGVTERQRPRQAMPVAIVGMRALVVDDNPLAAEILTRSLQALQMRADSVGSAREAYTALDQAAAEDPYRVVFMDHWMPEIDGAEATRRLRWHEAVHRSSRAPVVALTANALDDDRRACMEAGFDAYLAKPFEFRDLAETIERVCRRRSAPDALTRAS